MSIINLFTLFAHCLLSMIFVICFSGCIEHRTPPTRNGCVFNLKQIGTALHKYHEKYGKFPPRVIKDSGGQPAHSWRVLLLPFIEENGLYEQYDFSQPWDSVNNRKLLAKMPEVYRCFNLPDDKSGKTPFLAIVGKGTAWSQDVPLSLNDFKDSIADTAMVLELPDSPVFWTQPRDINLIDIKEDKESEVNALFVNGSIYGLKRDLLKTSLSAVFTRSKDDSVDRKLLKKAKKCSNQNDKRGIMVWENWAHE